MPFWSHFKKCQKLCQLFRFFRRHSIFLKLFEEVEVKKFDFRKMKNFGLRAKPFSKVSVFLDFRWRKVSDPRKSCKSDFRFFGRKSENRNFPFFSTFWRFWSNAPKSDTRTISGRKSDSVLPAEVLCLTSNFQGKPKNVPAFTCSYMENNSALTLRIG